MGNEAITKNTAKEDISALIRSGRLPHGVLIECDDDLRGAELAEFAASALVCTGEGKPCGKCPACLKAAARSHPDILTYSGGDTAKSFKVDFVRDIISKAYVIPNESEVKVFVLLKTQTMSEAAQNALLKILEEPPKFTRFILVCTAVSKMLPTVLSRCSVFRMPPTGRAWSENAVKAAEDLAAAAASKSEFPLIKAAAVFEKDKALLDESLEYLILIYRDAMAIRSSAGKMLSSSPEKARLLSSSLTLKALDTSVEAILRLRESLSRNANHNLLITLVCSELRAAAGRK